MIRLAPVLLLVACGGSDEPDPTTTGTVTGTGGTGTPTGSVTTGTPSGTTTPSTTLWSWDTPPWEEPVDCDALLPFPLASTTHTWVPSHEDFTISAAGEWIGSQGTNLVATPWGGPPAVLSPGVGGARGTRILPDGTIVLASTENGSLIRADPTTGAHWVVASGFTNPNGIAIGLDGWVYLATTGAILRIDPEDGTTETVASIPGRSFDGLTFSPDFRRLVFNEEIGRLHIVDFDENGVPGAPIQVGNVPISPFSLLDGMTMDACGNLWAVEMGGKVWRISADGTEVDIAAQFGASFIPALNFGTGSGGFERDRLYVQDFLGRMHELEVGIPGKWEPHLPWQ